MTLGFPGPLDEATAASCDRRRISPVMARDGIIGAQHPLVSSAGLRVLADGRQRGRRGGRGRARRDRRHARSLWHRGRSLRHRRPRECIWRRGERGSSCLPR